MSDKGTKWRDKREGNPGEKFFFFFHTKYDFGGQDESNTL
jgi:hypothetical protein